MASNQLFKKQHKNRHIKIVVAGCSNVGKTTLINSLCGSSLRVGNFDGTTVCLEEVACKYKSLIATFIDIPGIVFDELERLDVKLAISTISSQDYDILLWVSGEDASIEREVQTLLSLHVKKPVIFLSPYCLKPLQKLGFITIQTQILHGTLDFSWLRLLQSAIFGLQNKKVNKDLFFSTVLGVSNVQNGVVVESYGFAEKLKKFFKSFVSGYTSSAMEDTNTIGRRAQMRAFGKILSNRDQVKDFYAIINSVSISVEVERQKFAYKKVKMQKITTNINKLLMHKWLGGLMFTGIICMMFYTTFMLASPLSDAIEGSAKYLTDILYKFMPENLGGRKMGFNLATVVFVLSEGLLPAVAAALGFLPKIVFMMLWVSIIEQTGYLAKLSQYLHKHLRIFGLTGRSIIALISGFGCSVPAYMATRVLPVRSQRIITMIATSFIPCHAKMVVFLFFTESFFPKHPALVMFIIYFAGIVVALCIAEISSLFTVISGVEDVGAGLPQHNITYQFPQIKNLVKSAIQTVRGYISGAFLTIGTIAFVVWVLCHIPVDFSNKQYWDNVAMLMYPDNLSNIGNVLYYVTENSLLGFISKKVTILFKPLGFDWRLTTSLLTALTAKEICIATISVLYFNHAQHNLPLHVVFGSSVNKASAIAFIVVVLVWLPCTSAMATFIRECKLTTTSDKCDVNSKIAIWLVIINSAMSWCCGWLAYNIAKIYF